MMMVGHTGRFPNFPLKRNRLLRTFSNCLWLIKVNKLSVCRERVNGTGLWPRTILGRNILGVCY